MWIRELYIDGFGVWQDFALSLGPELSIFLGPNETGKTTLLNFIRAMWFGFARRGQASRGEPLAGGRHGGRLVLVTEKGVSYTLERYGGEAGPSSGTVQILDNQGNFYDEAFLTTLLGHVSKEVYCGIFAFGLTELEQLESLYGDEVGQVIYSAGVGAPVSIAQVEQELAQEAAQLYRPGARKPAINQLITELDELQEEITALRQRPEEYASVQREVQDLTTQLEDLEAQRRHLAEDLVWYRTLLSLWEQWEELFQIEQQLAKLPECFPVTEAQEEAMRQCQEREGVLAQKFQEQKRAVAQLQQQVQSLSPDNSLPKVASDLTVLLETYSGFEKNFRQSQELRRTFEQRDRQLQEILHSIGGIWSEAAVTAFDTGLQVRETIRRFAQQLAEAQAQIQRESARLESLRQRRAELLREAHNARERLEELMAVMPQLSHPYQERRRIAREFLLDQAKLTELLARREWLKEAAASAERDARRNQRGRGAGQIALGITILGAFLALAGGVGSWLGMGSWSLGVAGGGLVLALGGGIWWTWQLVSGRSTAGKEGLFPSSQVQIRDLLTTIEEYRRRLLQHGQILTGKEYPAEDEIFQAIDELEAEGELRAKVGGWQEQVAELEAKLREVETDYQAAAEAKEVARQEGQRLVEALQDWLQRRNLSPDLSPEGALEVVQLIRSAQDVLRARDEAEASWQVLMVEVNGFLDRLQVVLAGLGQPPVTPEGVFVVVAQLKATWERYQDLMDQLTAAQQSLEVTQEQYDVNQGIIDRLLAETNSEDIGDFYRNRRLFSEYSALRQRQEHLEIEIRARCGEWDLTQVYRALEETQREFLRQRVSQLEAQQQVAEESIARCRECLGRLRQRLTDLEQDERLLLLQLRADTLREELNRRARQWQKLAIAREIVTATRVKYEQERQPQVLQRASAFLRQMTDGRYQRVFAPLGQREIRVVGRDGRQLGVDQLSRGTVEQLYLAMRLALALEFGQRATPLPLVMDDILVNFDPQRLERACEVVREVAQQHQVLFFTCHPHVAQCLQAGGGTPIIPLAHR